MVPIFPPPAELGFVSEQEEVPRLGLASGVGGVELGFNLINVSNNWRMCWRCFQKILGRSRCVVQTVNNRDFNTQIVIDGLMAF